MRLIKLTLKGFKSYKDEVEIDFSKIPLNDLFLIQGKTGAGKSSLLDAIIFAIYDSNKTEYINFITNSLREDIEREPNKYKRQVITKVELEFEYLNKTYRIIKKILVKSVNPIQYNLELECYLENHKISDVPDFIKEIDKDQFTKSIIIPQNQFDQFLKSNVTEKEKILREIFRTNKYDDFINFINDDKLKESQKSLEDTKSKLKHILSHSNIDKSIEDESTIEEFQNKIHFYNNEIQNILKEKYQKEVQKQALQEEIKKLQDHIINFKEYYNILQQKRLHENKEKEITNFNQRLEKAKKVIDLYPIYEFIQKLSKDIKNREEIKKQNELQIQQKETLLQTKNKERQLLEDKKDEIEKLKLELKEKEHIYPKIDIYLKVKKELIEEDAKKNQKEKELKEVTLNLENIQNQIEEIYKSYLVKQLKDDEPCPICGSLEHPAPFISNLNEDPELLLKQKKALESKKMELEETLRSYVNKITKKEKEIQSIVEFLERKNYDLNNSNNLKTILSTDITNQKKVIYEYESQLNNVKNEILQLERELYLLSGKIQESEKIIKQNQVELKEKDIAFHKALQERGLSESHILEFYLEEYQRLQLEKEIQTYFNKKIELQAKLQQVYEKIQSIQSLKNIQLDEDFIQNQIQNFQKDLLLKQEEEKKLQYNIETYQQTIGQYKEILQRLKKSYEEYQSLYGIYKENVKKFHLIDTIYKLISDRNPKNLSFHRYIIQVYFDIVMEYANQRLKKINSRYILKSSEEKETARKQKAGLGIKIIDTYHGERDIKSLSGGETFYVSLSLALGLYDIIHSKVSNIHYDFLFIDEGFGSLDEETLQNVLATIKEIFLNEDKASKKQIGLISHVESMKQQIPHQIIINNQYGISSVQIKI